MIMKIAYFILLFTIEPSFCQDINKLFEDVNKQYGKFNAYGASLTWASSLNPDNDLRTQVTGYQKELIAWQQKTCETVSDLYSHNFLNKTQVRQSYLLCRGPKFTYKEARLSSLLYEKLQAIYSNVAVCIPIEKDINENNETAVAAAILNYLLSVEKKTNKYVMYATNLNDLKKMNRTFCLRGENDFQRMMSLSKDEKALRWLWLVWREQIGPPIKEPYMRFVKIENQASRRNGYTDIGASWRNDLEIDDLRSVCRQLYEDIKPMYKILHGVTRFYLRKRYGNVVPEKGPIPAHLLGDMWSQNWESLSDLLINDSIDLNNSIKEKNWTVTHMVKRTEDYYLSLGLPPMTNKFWSQSVFKPDNTSSRCHGTAADMFQPDDFRILYCLDLTMEDFYGLHHEFGHIHYYMAYEKQPAIFRQGNAAIHESIGDSITLGVRTPQHLHRLGLIDDKTLFSGDNTNNLFPNSNNNQLQTHNVQKAMYRRRRKKRDNGCDEQEIKSKGKKDYVNNNILINKIKSDRITKTFVTNIPLITNDKATNSTKCYENQITDTDNKMNDNLNRKAKCYKSGYRQDGRNIINMLNFNNIDEYNQTKKRNIYNTDGNQSSWKDNKIKENHKIYKRGTDDSKLRKAIPSSQPKATYLNNKDKNRVDTISDTPRINMNLDEMLLFKQALNKLPQIPYALILDEYRWRYFEGSLRKENGDFWQMVLELQGVSPPEFRGEEYFDIAAKFHVPDNTPYIRYFLSSFLQHQLFETFCKAAVFGRRKPEELLPDTISMNRCDIYGSTTVGKILRDFMSRGNSKHWRDILEELTGDREIYSMPLQHYYRNLFELLSTVVKKYHIPIGW